MDANAPILRGDQLDEFARALLTLAKELWVVKDRQRILEAAIAKAGVTIDVDAFKPDAALTEALAAERTRYVDEIMASLRPVKR